MFTVKRTKKKASNPPPPLLNLKKQNKQKNKTKKKTTTKKPLTSITTCATAIGVYFIFIGMLTRKKNHDLQKNEKIK